MDATFDAMGSSRRQVSLVDVRKASVEVSFPKIIDPIINYMARDIPKIEKPVS